MVTYIIKQKIEGHPHLVTSVGLQHMDTLAIRVTFMLILNSGYI